MNRRPFLVLHKSEWDRLQRQGGLPVQEPANDRTEYIKALTEQSRAWMKNWPDTFEGQLAKIEKHKKKQQKDNVEFIKTFKESEGKSKKKNTVKAIKEARQLIFEKSNYGRKLLSALLESRAIDERDAQIKFDKQVKEKTAELAKEKMPTQNMDFHDKDAEREKQEKLKMLECIRANQKMIFIKKEKELQEKLMETQCAIEDEKLMKQVAEIEKLEKDDIKRCEKQKLEEYKADTQNFIKLKEHHEKLTNALIEVYKNEQDRIKLKTRAVMKKVHQGRPDSKWSKDLYEKIKQFQTEEYKRYEDFVENGVRAYEQRNTKKETMDILQEKQKINSRYLESQMNKIAAEEAIVAKKCENKCFCDRQTLIMNLNNKSIKKAEVKASDESSKNAENKISDNKDGKFSFLASRNNLTEELRKREKEPSSWNGTKDEHKQFAEQAVCILKEINHKYFARKVVDEYRKLSCLDAATLPVPNY